jgi:hypothetical protein
MDPVGKKGRLGFLNLESQCLVEVESENCIRMHDPIRYISRNMANKKHPGFPLRLWRPTEKAGKPSS